ncbi:MAG: LytTR family DNA-binding domain-containing protein [Bacteroidota bacterium]
MALKVLIIEDEDLAARRLIRLIHELEDDVQVLDVLDSVKSSVNWLNTEGNKADLIFQDIHLADGNSFSIFEEVQIDTPIIFSTAYDQYAIQAFKVNSIDYLLKPVDKEELAQSLSKFKQSRLNVPMSQMVQMAEALREAKPKEFRQRFIVTAGEKIKSVPVEEIAYFFGQQKYVFLITKDNRRHIVDYTLGKLEDLLDPRYFFRINRQFIIHFSAIEVMHAYSKSRIKIGLSPEPEMDAIVSIDKSRKFKEWLNR